MKTVQPAIVVRTAFGLLVFGCAALIAAAGPARAQVQTTGVPVSGTVRTSTGAPLPGAVVSAGPASETTTDTQGRFSLTLLRGRQVLRVSHPAHITATRELDVAGPVDALEITLEPLARFSEEVVVAGVRADAEAPITKRDLDRQEIQSLNTGQEMPFLLERVPSVTQYSDSGSTTGYSYIYLRGVPQTRMNVTFDGVPLNEPEDSAFYFANFGDFADAVQSLQLQRGVGTSTVGATSFVGSINFASVDMSEKARADIRLGAGSFGTTRLSAAVHSGRLGGGFRLYGQAAYQDTAGFREHSGVTQGSGYFGVARDTDRSFLKIFGFVGHEQTQLAFLAADEGTLESNLRFNPMSPDERDTFTQGFVTAQYHRAINPASEFSVQGFYNGAGGWYRIDDPARGLQQYGLDWQNIGATAGYHLARGAIDFTWGAYVADFGSHHSRAIVDGPSDYSNRGFKTDFNTYAKLTYGTGRWHHYADAQVRWARFRYEGDVPLGSVDWAFFNPKIGTRYGLGGGASVYASIGRAGREPARSDMLQGEDNASVAYDLTAVKPEKVVDFETGVELARSTLTLKVNGFFMQFHDEIAQTGELSEIGLPLRRNVDRSFRRGVELDLSWQLWRELRVRSSATFSYNRIQSWTQCFDVYDAAGNWTNSTSRAFADVPPVVTPAVLVNASADYTPASWAMVGVSGRYVGESHLDNTGSPAFTAPGFFCLDAGASIGLARLLPFAATSGASLRIQVSNLLDNRRMFPNGYSYQFFTQDDAGGLLPGGTRYFYPLATRSFMVMLEWKL